MCIQPGNAISLRSRRIHSNCGCQGRECSDFQAFSMRALDKGVGQEIDPTTTKFDGVYLSVPRYFQNIGHWIEGIVQIVQDTCGRHDTFGLACTAVLDLVTLVI